jgi:HopA1 effector protein family
LLYDWCYSRRFDPAPAQAKAGASGDPRFVESLSAVNASRDRWDAGWRILQTMPSGQVVVTKGAITRMVWPGEFHAQAAPGLPPTPGTEANLFAPRESRTMQPGFYFVFGETLGDQEEDMSPVRFYWNIAAAGAAPLVAGVTDVLNRFVVPFRFKCLSMAGLYDRSDAAVLYIAKRYYRLASELLPEVHKAVKPFLAAATPLFSKRLAGGLGFAENPKSGESFGISRCRLVAGAVCNAHARGIDAPDARLSAIAGAFAETGLSLERPFLNPGSADRYAFLESRAA